MNFVTEKIKKIFQNKEIERYLRPVLTVIFFCVIASLFVWAVTFLYGTIGKAVEKPAHASPSSLGVNRELFNAVAPRLGITPP